MRFARLVAVALVALWTHGAGATAPSVDNSSAGGSTSTNAASQIEAVNATHAGDIVVITVGTESPTGTPVTASTVIDTGIAGLTFTKWAGAARTFTSNCGGSIPACSIDTEVWWAYSSGTLTSENVTVTLTGTAGEVGVSYASVIGVYSHTTPFDVNASLPLITAGANSIPTATGFSTSSTDDLLIVWGTSDTHVPPGVPCFLTFSLWNANFAQLEPFIALFVEGASQAVTGSRQSNVTIHLSTLSADCPAGQTNVVPWTIIAGALAGTAPVVPGGGMPQGFP